MMLFGTKCSLIAEAGENLGLSNRPRSTITCGNSNWITGNFEPSKKHRCDLLDRTEMVHLTKLEYCEQIGYLGDLHLPAPAAAAVHKVTARKNNMEGVDIKRRIASSTEAQRQVYEHITVAINHDERQ
ncbi:Hypothetical predicted protein [Octopus vulgaris]|uniref:Uncharacterized protein n=1 Tax=Octopus vulgaris TaxID=6645 RepID=A0AA36EVW4_OCTVU|nr:Hypothetical predicted protein [Octopus vulgaris]